jgi:dUTP pyrophosphatase
MVTIMRWISIRLIDPACLPTRKTAGASGFDLVAREDVVIGAGEVARVPCGVALEVPLGLEVQVRGRSGLTLAGILCQLGTCDADYRGEISAVLYNTTKVEWIAKRRDRVAQLVFASVEHPRFDIVPRLTETARGESGFGSTGLSDE